MPSRWDTFVPKGSDTAPITGAVRFDPNDPFESRAGPFWYTAPDMSTTDVSNGLHNSTSLSRAFWLRVQERHCNSISIVHGGLLMTLADLTMADAARDGNGDWVTVSFDSQFVDSAKLGDLLHSTAVCTRRTGRMAFVRGVITSVGSAEGGSEQESRQIFTFSGVFSRVGGTKPARL